MILRDYQERAVSECGTALRSGGRPLLASPTGSGKTVMSVEIIRRMGVPTLFVGHRREIITQACGALSRGGLTVGAIMAGMQRTPHAQVQVASVQTLQRRDKPQVGLVVFDECHHARAKSWSDIADAYPGVPLFGMTGTPWRLDGSGLGNIFDSIIVAAYTDELCASGVLVEPVVYAPDSPDMSRVHRVHGDYNMGEAAVEMRKPKIIGNLVATWLQRAAGMRTILFAPTVAVSKEYVEAFKAAGVSIEHLDGGTPKAQRDAILHRLRTGYTQLVSNVGIIDEGFDLPALDCAIVARPTQSLCWHLQSIGRIMRSAEGKTGAIVLDHAGNHLRHGRVTERVEYSLDDKVAGVSKSAPSRLKRCPRCFLVVAVAAKSCQCGHEFKGREIERGEGELVLLDSAKEKPRPSLAEQQATWNAIDAERRMRAFREGWSFHRFEERYGFRPLVFQGTVCDPATCGMEVKKAIYENFLADVRSKGQNEGRASHLYRSIFGVWPRFRRVG